MKRVRLSLAGMVLLASTPLAGQPQRAFEVASIKPAPPLTPELLRSPHRHLGIKIDIDSAQADFGGLALGVLVTYAYGVRLFQVSGPDWMSARFDILAKLPEGATPDQVPEMLQTLLAKRFKLTLHRGTKEFPAYALIVAKDGPKLTPRPADYHPTEMSDIRPMSLDSFAEVISEGVDKPVFNKTQLTGEYMLSAEAIMDEALRQAVTRASAGGAASEPAGAAILDIVQSLGLKLEARNLPVPLLVIDHLEKMPTDN
jgi:uncharacterized protein (TIGR03435 family)